MQILVRRAKSKTLIAMCFLLIFISGCGTEKYYLRTEADIKNIKKIVVLPFENFTSDEHAGEKVRRIVITELISQEMDVVEPGEISKLFRELKIKYISSIQGSQLQEIGKTLGADAVIIGVVENFGISDGISVKYPEVTIILRMIETSTGSVIWSIRQTSGGPDFWTRHFGSEGPSLSETAKKVVKEAIGTLF
ncbi:MAG: DUF799 family lipoprotein [Nitrospirae bacterium]|nr:DUF799 family lipoprotein [Nitrospirota bacterium]